MPRYVEITAEQSPFFFGTDEQGRSLVSCNYSVMVGLVGLDGVWLLDIITILNNLGEGLVFGTDTFIGAAADIPIEVDPVVSFISSAAGSPEITHNNDTYVKAEVQSIVRGDYDSAMNKSWSIFDKLHNVRNLDVP